MTPESSEGRERITRMEVQVAANKSQIEALAPLSLQVGVMAERLDSLRQDLHEAELDHERRLERHEKRIDVKLEEMSRSFGNQIAACSSQVGQLADTVNKFQESERKRREDLEATTRQDRVSEKTSRRAMWGLIGAAAVTGFLTLVATLLQAVT